MLDKPVITSLLSGLSWIPEFLGYIEHKSEEQGPF